jgi:hypothetical protein
MEWHEFDIELAEVILGDITSALPKDTSQLNAKGQDLVRQHHELEIAVDMWHRFGNLDINFLVD